MQPAVFVGEGDVVLRLVGLRLERLRPVLDGARFVVHVQEYPRELAVGLGVVRIELDRRLERRLCVGPRAGSFFGELLERVALPEIVVRVRLLLLGPFGGAPRP